MRELQIEKAGQVIRDLRSERGIGLNELAARMGWDKGRLSKYETNQLGLSLSAVGEIAKALHVRPEVLVFECLKQVYPRLRRDSEERQLLEQLIEKMGTAE